MLWKKAWTRGQELSSAHRKACVCLQHRAKRGFCLVSSCWRNSCPIHLISCSLWWHWKDEHQLPRSLKNLLNLRNICQVAWLGLNMRKKYNCPGFISTLLQSLGCTSLSRRNVTVISRFYYLQNKILLLWKWPCSWKRQWQMPGKKIPVMCCQHQIFLSWFAYNYWNLWQKKVMNNLHFCTWQQNLHTTIFVINIDIHRVRWKI